MISSKSYQASSSHQTKWGERLLISRWPDFNSSVINKENKRISEFVSFKNKKTNKYRHKNMIFSWLDDINSCKFKKSWDPSSFCGHSGWELGQVASAFSPI